MIWVIKAPGTANREAIAASLALIKPEVIPKAATDAARPETIKPVFV
jgi:hypothetical protein